MSHTGLVHSHTHIPRGPFGSVSRVAVGAGGGTVVVGVGAILRAIVVHIECKNVLHQDFTQIHLTWGFLKLGYFKNDYFGHKSKVLSSD